ncbi:MAG TPA: mechanosensitive ion channel protein [Spirochaetaceae bacterium]|nr:mechanosensitive ion channel protein [Spirochaetaceae bacterium]
MENYLNQAVDFLKNSGYRTFAAIFVLIIGIYIIRNLLKLIKLGILSTEIDTSLVNFILTIVKFVFYLALILYCLSIMRVSMTGFIAALSALTLAIGLSIQNTISSVANGIVLFFIHPFKVGDFIDINGVSGSVREINIMHTILNTPDNRRVIMPNSSVFNGTIVNYSANQIRRVDLKISVDYDADTEFARKVLLEACGKHPLVLKEPAPTVRWNAHNDSYLEFVIKVWTESNNYWSVAWDLDEIACRTLQENGICIPFPQITLSYRDGSEGEKHEKAENDISMKTKPDGKKKIVPPEMEGKFSFVDPTDELPVDDDGSDANSGSEDFNGV